MNDFIKRFLLLFKKNHFGYDYNDNKIFVCRCKKLFGKLYYIEELIFDVKKEGEENES